MSLTAIALLAQVAAATPTSAAVVARPFAVGERFTYKGSLRTLVPIPAGSAVLAVEGIETMRGVPSWRFTMKTSISSIAFKARSELTSWTGVDDFISRRFLKFTTDTGVNRPAIEDFNIHPDSGFFRRGADTGRKATPKDPLDDVAFLYYVRTIPLQVGDSLTIPRYYRAEVLNLTVRVSGRETLELPDGQKVSCLILHPVVNQRNGMFRAEAKAKLWMTDDARRIPVRIESSGSYGRVRLQLDEMVLPPAGR